MFRLSICAETVFGDLPFELRLKEIAAAGFLVDFWRWIGHDVERIAAEPGVQISSFTGYIAGSLVHPDGLDTFLDGVEQTLAVAAKLRCRELVLSTGEIDDQGQVVHRIAAHPATRWITAYKGLCRIAEMAEEHDVTYSLEPLNTKHDHRGYPLPHAEDAVRLIEAVGSRRIRLLLDVYHTQIEEGNVTQVIRDFGEFLGYVHVADVPGRHEPGTGEINYPHVVRALREVGYDGAVALEAYPAGNSHQAMSRFREVFSCKS
ncbi:MAG TPA: TIM barrel protein [Pirellulales bacterium]|nr:TIM barrel protein [Pirellulales bacterium]